MRILFFPSSSGRAGFGEIARCSIIARACLEQSPGTEVLFLHDEKRAKRPLYGLPVRYYSGRKAEQDAFIRETIRDFDPQVVVFDCQLSPSRVRICRSAGVRIVSIAARRTHINRTLRLHNLMLVDLHVIHKLRVHQTAIGWFIRNLFPNLAGKVIEYDVIVAHPSPEQRTEIVSRYVGADDNYVLFCPGGGGGRTKNGLSVAEEFLQCAERLAQAFGLKCLLVCGPMANVDSSGRRDCTLLTTLDNDELMALAANALFVVTGGGSILPQVLTQGVAVLAAPLGPPDQVDRIRMYLQEGVIRTAECDAEDLFRNASVICGDDALRAELRRRALSLGLVNGLDAIVQRMLSWE